MYIKDDKKYNCCESVLLFVNEKLAIPGFNESNIRAASNLGGGGSGWGSLCGAINGGCQIYGLLMGPSGDESPEEFLEIKERMKEKNQIFIRAFEEKWGSCNCFDILGYDTRTPEGKRIHEERKADGTNFCGDIVRWSAKKIIELVESDPDIHVR